MSRKLVLFTNSYPFGKGESFLDSELQVIANFFDRVIIQPMTYGGSCLQRPTPGKVLVKSPILPKNRYIKAIFSLLNLFKYKGLRHQFFEHRVFLSRKRFYNYLLAVAAKIYLSKHFRDLVIDFRGATLYFYWGIGAAFLIPELKSLTRSRIVMRLHGGDLYEDINRGYIPLRKAIFQSADVICPISDHGRDYLLDRYPEIKERIVVSRLGTKDYGPGMFMPDQKKIVLISCANLIPLKRIHLLARLLAQYTDLGVTWHHFGDGPEYQRIMNVISGYPHNIQSIFHGWVSNQKILDFYIANHFDAFVSVSSSEGVPVSIMEAMSFGLPVIATDVGGISEILYREGSVLLPADFSPPDFRQALEAVRALAQSADMRERIRQHWRWIASAENNYKTFAEDILINECPLPSENKQSVAKGKE